MTLAKPPGAVRLLLLGMAAGCAAAQAQDAATGGSGLRLSTYFSAEEIVSQVHGRPDGDNGVGTTTRLSPGLSLVSNGARLRGTLNYRADLVSHHGATQTEGALNSGIMNSLDAAFVVEAVPNWAYVDARASVTQQSISAYGQPAGNLALANANSTEVRTATLSPYIRGSLAGVADYEVRLTGSTTSTRNDATPNSHSEAALVNLGSTRRGARFGWGLMAMSQRVGFSGPGGTTTTDRAVATLFYNPDPDVQLSVNAGSESNDVGGVQRQSYRNYGASVRWTPSPRTLLLVQEDKRYFGHSHLVQFQHRGARTMFSFSDTRDVTSGVGANGVGQPLTLYAVFFQLLAAQYPDPTMRDLQVRLLIASLGARPDDMVAGGSLAAGITTQRRQDLSAAYEGQRALLSLQAFRSNAQLIGQAALQQPAQAEPVVQSGYSATLSYRLTPVSTLALLGSRVMTQGNAVQAGVDQKMASLSLTTRLGPRTTGMLRGGYTVFNSPTLPSRETSVAGSISLRF